MRAAAPGGRARRNQRARLVGDRRCGSSLDPPPWPGDRGRVSRLLTKVISNHHNKYVDSSKGIHGELGLLAAGVRGEERCRDIPAAVVLIPTSSSLPSVKPSCETPAPANHGNDDELACARDEFFSSKKGLTSPVAAASPLIVGRVVRTKTKPKNTLSSCGDVSGEEVADFYGQLWVVPSPRRHPRPHKSRPLPPNPRYAIPKLFWVRRDLFQAKTFTVEDCFPVDRPGRFDPTPTKFQLSLTGLPPGSSSFADVVKKGIENHGQNYQNRRP